MDPADHAQRARSFGRIADAYERYRPAFPPEPLQAVLQGAGIEDPGTAVDIGAGTGKLTRVLATLAHEVIAVEPDDEMRARLQAEVPDAIALNGTAEDLPLDDATADVVACADAFHWFDADRTVAEAARVLRAGGVLVVCSHDAARADGDPLWDALGVLTEGLTSARQRTHIAEGGPAIERSPAFGLARRLEREGTVRMDRAGYVGLMGTFSGVSTLPPDRRAAFDAEVERIFDRHGDRPLGAPYRLVVDWATRTDA